MTRRVPGGRGSQRATITKTKKDCVPLLFAVYHDDTPRCFLSFYFSLPLFPICLPLPSTAAKAQLMYDLCTVGLAANAAHLGYCRCVGWRWWHWFSLSPFSFLFYILSLFWFRDFLSSCTGAAGIDGRAGSDFCVGAGVVVLRLFDCRRAVLAVAESIKNISPRCWAFS